MRPDGRELPGELRLGDLEIFFAVRRCGAVTSASRALGVSPSSVSKAIARLEARLHTSLLSRGAQGVTLTDEALSRLPDLERALAHLHRAVRGTTREERTLHFAGPSFLVSLFAPIIARALPEVRLCALELPPAVLRSCATENQFALSLLAGRAGLPSLWHARQVGELRRSLFARPSLANTLAPFPVEPARVQALPFITPVYTLNGQFVHADDGCPLAFTDRQCGHKTQTLGVALDLAMDVDQVVFAPCVAARERVAQGRLVEVPVRGWLVSEPMILACHPERLLAHEFNTVAEALEHSALARDAQDPAPVGAEVETWAVAK